MNLQEQISRIQSMMGVINEDENHINRILDKIIKYGIEKLTDLDRQYLDNPTNQELNQMINNRKNRVDSLWDYDPRRDTEFFDDLSTSTGIDFDFSEFTDEDIEEGRYSIMYDEIDDDDIKNFITIYNIPGDEIKDTDGNYKEWESLSKKIQNNFKEFVNEFY
jgi:hypothetical protein